MLGRKIKQLRTIYGFNMKQTSERLNIPYTTYVGYEKGEREPNSDMIKHFSNFFNVPVNFLLELGVFSNWDKIFESKENIAQSLNKSFLTSNPIDLDNIIMFINIIDSIIEKIEFEDDGDFNIYFKKVYEDNEVENKSDLFYNEKKLINKYRSLDNYGKEVVNSVLDFEYKRCVEQQSDKRGENLILSTVAARSAGNSTKIHTEYMEDLSKYTPDDTDL